MIYKIRGVLDEKTPTYIVLDVQQIFYKIHISLQTHQYLGDIGQIETLYTIYVVRPDTHQLTETTLLYGFKQVQERLLFEKLISVSGIGFNTARLMLSYLTVEEFVDAIEREDVKTLKGIKGIGEKSAQRIIVDLRGKLKDIQVLPYSQASPSIHDVIKKDAFLALQTLGFQDKSIHQALNKVQSYQNAQDLIRAALHEL